MNDLTFPLLAALATVEELEGADDAQKKLLEKLDGLRQELQTRLRDILERSDFTEKSRLRASIEESLADAAFLATCPELLGKTCVAIIMADSTADNIVGELTIPNPHLDAFCKHGMRPYGTHIHVPQMLVHTAGSPKVKLMSSKSGFAHLKNVPGHDAAQAYVLTSAEYDTFLNLEADGIAPAQVARAVVWHVQLIHENTVYLLLRPDDVSNPALATLLNQCEAAIICGILDNDACLEALAASFHMPVYFVNSDLKATSRQIEFLRNSFIGREIKSIVPHDIKETFFCLNGLIQRITLKDRIYSELLALLEDTNKKISCINILNDKIDSIVAVSCNGNGNLLSLINSIKESNLSKTTYLNRLKSDIKNTIKCVLEMATLFEKELGKYSSNTNGWHKPWLNCGSMRPETVWRRIILRSLESGDNDVANHYQRMYAEKFPEYAFITQLYKDKKFGGDVSIEALERLRYMRDSQEVFRAKIFWRRELGLSEHDCAEIAGLMKRPQTADEQYYRALHLREKYDALKGNGGKDDALFEQVLAAHWDAILAGSEDAANELAMYCGAERLTDQATELASTSNAMSLYVAGLLAAVNGDPRAKKRYMNMAAARGHEKALVFAAESLWQQRLVGKEKVKDGVIGGINSDKLANSLAFYLALCKYADVIEKIPGFKERLGFYYYCSTDWINASAAIGECPETTDGQFALALMKRYGYGMRSDRTDSIKLIRQAESGSGPCATLAATIKKDWLQKELKNI